MNRRILTLTLAAALSAAAALAQKQAPPAPGQPKGFRVPTPREFKLDNGLEVTLVDYGTVPKATVELSVLTGNASEAANQVWLADLTGDLMAEGTTTKSATDVSTAAARMGGSLDINVGPDRTEIAGDVLSEFAPEMARLIADVVRNPKLPDAEVARLKADMLRNLSIAK